MDAIGSKLNRLKNRRGLSIVEVLVSVALLGLFVSALNMFTVSTFSSMKMMRAESFVRIFNTNIDQLLNSQRACITTFTQASIGSIANGDSLVSLFNAGGGNVLNMGATNLNGSNVDILTATVANLQNTAGNIRFNLEITYRYNTFSPALSMVKIIPINGTVDAGNNVITCASARSFLPETLFIRSDINDIKTGSLTITGNLTFNYAGGGDTLNKLIIEPQVANPAAPGGPNNTLFIPSDRKLKKDIQPINLAESDFNQIHAYHYKLKGQKDYSIGFLSQEVQKFSPDSVLDQKDSYMALNYNSMLPYIWEYHKQVYHKNIELNKRLKALEEKIDKLK